MFVLQFRVGQRGTGMSATIARSEHEISEIIDGLSEQEVSAVNFETSQFKVIVHYHFL